MANTPNDILKESISALVDGETDDFDLRRVLKEAETSPAVRETWRRYHLIGAALRGELRDTGSSIQDASKSQSAPQAQGISQAVGYDLAARVRATLNHPSESSAEHSAPAVEIAASASGTAGTPVAARWWEGAGKASIAATVAIGVLLGVQQFGGGIDQMPLEAVADVDLPSDQSATVFVPAGFQVPFHSAQHASAGSQSAGNTSYLNSATYRPITLKASRVASNQELQEYLNHVLLKHAEQASTAGGLGVVPIARVSKLDNKREAAVGGHADEKSIQQQQ